MAKAKETMHPMAETLLDALTRITHPKEAKADGYTARDIALAEACREVGGCATDKLHALVALLAERKLPPISGGERGLFPKGTVIVIEGEKKANGHSYRSHEPIMVWENRHGLTMNISVGNYLPIDDEATARKDEVRKATPEEIRAYVAKVWEKIAIVGRGGAVAFRSDYGPAFMKFLEEVAG